MSESPPSRSNTPTRRKRKGRPWMPQKNARRVMRQTAERALGILDVALNIAAGSASDTGIPALSSALAALREVVRKIQTMKTNIEGVDTLEQRVAELKDLVEKCCLRPRGNQFEDIQQRIDALCATLSRAAEDARGIKSRGIIKRFFTSNSDAKKLQGLVEDINRVIRDFVTQTVMIIDQNVRAIKTHLEMSFLSMYAKHAQYDSDIVRRGCLEGTREAVLKDAYDWIEASSKTAAKAVRAAKTGQTAGVERLGHFLWISGLAGTGKTTIAFSLAEKCLKDDILGADFFCSRSDAECSDPNNIFITIVRQLCQFYAPYKEKVAAALEKNPDIGTAGPLRQFQILILEPLRELNGVFPVCVIIIDALDECHDGGVTSIILGILARHIQELTPFLFVVTSRPEPHITAVFERAHAESLKNSTTPLVLHNVRLKSVLDDIRHYLADGFEEIHKVFFIEGEWPSNQDLDKLAELSQGLFIFATTVLRFIRDADYGNPKQQLQALLSASVSIMDDLYREVLTSAYKNVNTLHEINPSLRRVLGAITLAEEPLSTAALANLLGMSESDVRNILAKLRAVLHIPEEGSVDAIRFIHPTFPEFLLSTSMVKPEAFRIDPAEHHLTLFTQSLATMDNLKRNITGIERSATFRSEIPRLTDIVKTCIPAHVAYACRFWSAHLSRWTGNKPEQHSWDLLNRFLTTRMLYWLEACSLLRILDGVPAALETAERACQKLGGPFASLAMQLADCRRFLWSYHYCIDIAPLQVYHSALGLAPTESTVREAYTRELGGSLIVRRGALPNWSPRRDAFIGHDGEQVNAIAFSPGGECFITGGGDRRLKMWKTTTRTMVQSFDGHMDNVNCVAFSPEGAHVASGSGDLDVRVWQVSSGECVRICRGHSGGAWFVSYSADGSRLLSATWSGEVKLWDTADWRCILTLEGMGSGPCQTSLSPDGGVIARASKGSLLLHSEGSLSLHSVSSAAEETLDFPDAVCACTFSPDGRFVAAGSSRVIRVWQCADMSLFGSTEMSSSLYLCRLAFSRDGTRIACGSLDGSVFIWQVASEDPPLVLKGDNSLVWDVAWSPDGLQVASASFDGIIRVCDAAESPAHTEEPIVSQPCPIPYGPPQFVLVRHGVHTVLLHLPSAKVDVTDFVIASPMPEGAPTLMLFTDMIDAWNAALQVVENVSTFSRSLAWAVITGQQHAGPSPEGSVMLGTTYSDRIPFSISPNGLLLAYQSTSNYTVDVCNLHTGQVAVSLTGHTNHIFSVAFSPDSALVATGAIDGSVNVWRTATGDIIHSRQGHTERVSALAFSSDGRLVASGSGDASVHVFEAETEHVKWVSTKHIYEYEVIEVIFTPEDKHVLALHLFNQVYIWDVASGTRTYEIRVTEASWTRSLLVFSSDETVTPVEGHNLEPRPLPICDTSNRTWPAYTVSPEGWIYARSPGRVARLCWLPPEWRNLLSWDGPRFCCADVERRTAVGFDVSRLPEYIQNWGS